MALTHIDYHFYSPRTGSARQASAGKAASSSGKIEEFSLVALNPSKTPGSLVVAGSGAIHGGIGSQVACRLATEHFIDGVLEFFDQRGVQGQHQKGSRVGDRSRSSENKEFSQEVLEAAFKNANSSVYSFGHQLSAGGRLAASLIGLVVELDSVAAGRVGPGAAYLFRAGEVFPFFDQRQGVSPIALAQGSIDKNSRNDNYIGSHSLVSVELATVPVKESDCIILLPQELNAAQLVFLRDILKELKDSAQDPAQLVAKELLHKLKLELSYVMLAAIGPEAIFLTQPLRTGTRAG